MLPQQMYSTQISAPLNHCSGTDTGRDPNTSPCVGLAALLPPEPLGLCRAESCLNPHPPMPTSLL